MKNTKRVLQLGIFIAVGMILFIIAIYLIGSKGNLFSSTTNVFSSFKDIRGLIVGNNVRFAGINVGTVDEIKIVSDSSVIVTMSIRQDYTKYIYKNSTAQIGQEGLMGGKIVLISSGNAETGNVEEGDYLAAATGLDIQAMIAQAQGMLEEATKTVSNLASVTGKINEGDGDISRLLNKNEITTQLRAVTNSLNASMADVNSITNKVNSGQGDLGKLVNESTITTQLSGIMENLNATSARADSAIAEIHKTIHGINHGEGVLSRLIYDKELGMNVDTAITKVDKGVTEVTRAAGTIADSWIFRIFSRKKDEKSGSQKEKEVTVQPGDTIIIPRNKDEIQIRKQ